MRDERPMPVDVGAWLDSPSVQALMAEDEGAYWHLLCFAWRYGSIPAKAGELRNILGMQAGQFRRVWERVSQFWVPKPGTADRLINERQEQERSKLDALAQRMRKVRRSGAPRHEKDGTEATCEAPAS